MRRSLWLAVVCLAGFALSWAYVVFYLRGSPRIIDATSYFLEARSLAEGSFQFSVPDPTSSFRGRFLLAGEGGHALGVIFPPGYPLVLAIGFWLGCPLLIGPFIGAALVGATYLLARIVTGREEVARLAALLSVVSAALRYHTADTMSHGLSALLLSLSLSLCLIRGRRSAPLLAGLCLGLMLATRPVSGGVALLICFLALRSAGFRSWLFLIVGTLPGLALWIAQQRVLTGDFFGSAQVAYYASSDAPEQCFRYGFGANVGCRFEHGEFVERFLKEGFGLRAALRNSAVRFGSFAVDATNAAPLTALGALAAYRHFRTPISLLTLGIGLQALAYFPFYFDGNFPGGGARFLCEVIPFCQVLVACAAVDLKLGRYVVPASLAGLLLHARFGHEQLRDREGGRPMFEPSVLARAGVTSGLVFVGTDHGFNLGHDPAVAGPETGLFVARERGDARDRELFERLGKPRAFRYQYSPTGAHAPRVIEFVPARSSRYEAEAEWPALTASGRAYPIHFPCASRGAALRLFPGSKIAFAMTGELGGGPLEIGWVSTRPGGSALLVEQAGSPDIHLTAHGPGCSILRSPTLRLNQSKGISLSLLRGEGAVDFLSQ